MFFYFCRAQQIGDQTAVTIKFIFLLERWVSGLNQQFAKLPYGKLYRGFESPSLRNDLNKPRASGVVYFSEVPRKACFLKELKKNSCE